MRRWDEAAERWLEDRLDKATVEEDRRKLQWLSIHLSPHALGDINGDVLRVVIRARLAEGSSHSTVNRYMALVRAILRRAVRVWEWLDKAPHVPMFREPRGRTTWLEPDQARALFAELPEHLRAPFVFSLAMGLRMRNVVRLRWAEVHQQRSFLLFEGDRMKAGDPFAPALNESAQQILHAQRGKHSEYVFTYKGKPMARASTSAWYRAKERAGLKHVRWHDLRHTWATWHVLAGTSLDVVQDLGGWKTKIMVRRYAHLQPGAHRAHAVAVDGDVRRVMGNFDQEAGIVRRRRGQAD